MAWTDAARAASAAARRAHSISRKNFKSVYPRIPMGMNTKSDDLTSPRHRKFLAAALRSARKGGIQPYLLSETMIAAVRSTALRNKLFRGPGYHPRPKSIGRKVR